MTIQTKPMIYACASTMQSPNTTTAKKNARHSQDAVGALGFISPKSPTKGTAAPKP